MYDIDRTEKLFVAAVRENCGYHYRNCTEYRMILDHAGFSPESIAGMEDIPGIPFLPTLFFKRHAIFSMPEDKIRMEVLSSGTSGMAKTTRLTLGVPERLAPGPSGYAQPHRI